MDAQATRLVLVPAATAARGVASALPAALSRGLTAFEEQPVDALHARHWVEQLRSTGPPCLPASARPAGSASTLRARRPPPVPLAPAGAQDSLTGPWVCVLPPGVMVDCLAGHGSLVLTQK
jgi:hypothetical protein